MPHVLIVEDDSAQSDLYMQLLEGELRDIEFIVSPTAAEAYEQLDSDNDFQLCILDIDLEFEGVGYTVLAAIKNKDRKLPTIVVSGRTTGLDEMASLMGGALYYFQKPVDPRVFVLTVKNLVSVTTPHRATKTFSSEITFRDGLFFDQHEVVLATTDTERVVLNTLVENTAKLVETMALAESVYPPLHRKGLHMVIHRLRKKIVKSELPIVIESVGQGRGSIGYKLVLTAETETEM